MRRAASLLIASLAGCGHGEAMRSAPPSPDISSAAVHCAAIYEPDVCAADPACRFFPNTRPCRAGQPCPLGWCSPKPDGSAPDPRPVCGCGLTSGMTGTWICVAPASGGTTCERVPAGCAAADVCSCLSTATRRCQAAQDVRGLCRCG